MKKLVLPIVALLALSGCSSTAGVAAVVGERVISVNDVQKSTNDVIAERNKLKIQGDQNLADLSRTQFRFHMLSAVVDTVAEKSDITITEAEIDARHRAIRDQLGGEDALASAMANASISRADFPRYLRDVIIEDKIATKFGAVGISDAEKGQVVQAVLQKTLEALKVNVNPRYGTLNTSKLDVENLDTTGGSAFQLK